MEPIIQTPSKLSAFFSAVGTSVAVVVLGIFLSTGLGVCAALCVWGFKVTLNHLGR